MGKLEEIESEIIQENGLTLADWNIDMQRKYRELYMQGITKPIHAENLKEWICGNIKGILNKFVHE